MNIIRLGRLFSPDEFEDGFTHAANPFPIILSDSLIRVIFNRRDKKNRSSVFSVDINYNDGVFSCIKESLTFLMGPGEIGLFDDGGVSVGSLISSSRYLYSFYYMGWNVGGSVPWRNSIGIAIYNSAENSLKRERRAPIIDRSEEDPFTLSYPWVVKRDGKYFAFYGSNQRWDTEKVDIDHVLKISFSNDGLQWKNKSLLKFNYPDGANAFCRPSLIELQGKFYLGCAFRGEKYKIGFLRSTDFENWIWDSIFSPDPSSSWESSEVTYPAFFKIKGDNFFLYCGNEYGKTGFGVARFTLDS